MRFGGDFPLDVGDLEKTRQELLVSVDERFAMQRAHTESQLTDIRQHFDFVAEQLKHDVLGAFRDFISLERDRWENHERRIDRLEQKAM